MQWHNRPLAAAQMDHAVSDAAANARPELRYLTTQFADLVGYTAERLDPELLRRPGSAVSHGVSESPIQAQAYHGDAGVVRTDQNTCGRTARVAYPVRTDTEFMQESGLQACIR
jgi:hypothetical protein